MSGPPPAPRQSPKSLPNPATDYLYLEAEGIEEYSELTYALHDPTGRLLTRGTWGWGRRASLRVEEYPPGLYAVTLYRAGVPVGTRRVVVR